MTKINLETLNALSGDCDCCGKARRLTQCFTHAGLETWACAECRGVKFDEPEEHAL